MMRFSHSIPLILAVLLLLPTACRKEGQRPDPEPTSEPHQTSQDPASESPVESAASFRLNWNPNDGRGSIVETLENGDLLGVCFQCGYEGYAGGLYIGNMDAPGFIWTPKVPRRGFSKLNIFCAQDESLFDEQTQTEYSPGWSENFGTGEDGRKLHYVEGAVIEDGTKGNVVLMSVNQGDCYRVTRYLQWPRGAAYILITSYVQNICTRPREFSFWTGDDPWLGLYRSSDGDVGWFQGGIVQQETRITGDAFKWGGFYDLGNAALGQDNANFSNVADFIQPDPNEASPDEVFFANSFAHTANDITPNRPLDNGSMTALNLGWTHKTLAPGQEWRVAYAMGIARTGEPGSLPKPPDILRDQWSFDRALHHPVAPARPPLYAEGLQFRGETIDLNLSAGRLTVDGVYHIKNRTAASVATHMAYPFPSDPRYSYPDTIEVTGAELVQRGKEHAVVLRLKPHEERTFKVHYEQNFTGCSAAYILRTTQAWGEPLEYGKYSITWPATWKDARPSYRGETSTVDGNTTLHFERTDFLPARDLELSWTCSPE